MKKYIPYLIAALVGFHLRWIVSALNGWSYSMNGAVRSDGVVVQGSIPPEEIDGKEDKPCRTTEQR